MRSLAWIKKNGTRLLMCLILLAGIFVRVWCFGEVPGDINQDEAFAGYEAWSILNGGIDSAGYRFPVYLTAWGSGMNALESYLMIPFIAALGLSVWVIRLPQLIVGCLSLWVCFLTVRRLCGKEKALLSLLLLAVCPWHVLLSRWALESNLAPGFLLFGLYFFVKGLDRDEYLPVSAVMYGLSLYAYATVWLVVPLIILAQTVYCVVCRRLRPTRCLYAAALILAVMALPLLLFLAVNSGLMDEIRLPFMSVPRLLYMRSGEISFAEIPENLKNLWQILSRQTDGLPWNYAGKFGLYYRITFPFIIFGVISMAVSIYTCAKGKRFCPEVLVLIQLLAGLIVGALIKVNVNRVNIIFIPLLITAALGVYMFCALFGKRLIYAAAVLYLLMFAPFSHWYFTDYAELIKPHFTYGIEQALGAVSETDGTVYVTASVHYPKLLFYSRMDTEEFIDTVRYSNYPAAFLKTESFGRFCYVYDLSEPDTEGCYILDRGTDISMLLSAGFTAEEYGCFVLVLPPGG